MATAKKTRPVPDMGTLVPAMGIVPWREEKLEAIHKSVLLMLEHVHRLVTQKETLCELYMGEKQKAAVSLSLKINSLLKRQVGLIFLDDADLVDDVPAMMGLPGVQVFVAQVVANQKQVEVFSA